MAATQTKTSVIGSSMSRIDGPLKVSGNADYTGARTATVLGNTVAGSRFTGQYDGLNFGNGGLALTYGGFTIGGNLIGGRLNGQLQLTPQGGVSELAYMFGAKYTAGPLVMGIGPNEATHKVR